MPDVLVLGIAYKLGTPKYSLWVHMLDTLALSVLRKRERTS
jgi:hypothetical protein